MNTDYDKEDLEDLLIQILREFDFEGPWPTLEVLVEGECSAAIVSIELGELLERARELVLHYE